MTFFVISILTLNIILWIVLLVRFKKLFSTDDIVSETQKKVEHLIREIDNAADRDTYLAKETSKRIQDIMDEAEKKMELFKEATDRLRDMIAEADRINKGQRTVVTKKIDPDAAYEINIKSQHPEQGNLFEQTTQTENPGDTTIQTKAETYKKPYQEVPLIITKVYEDQPKKMSQEEIRKNMISIVRKKFNEGATPEEIAANLNCSITEIQFIIDMM